MSYFKPRNLLLILALLLAVVLAVMISRNFRPEDRLAALVKTLPEGVTLALQDIDYTHIENGLARWRLTAGQVERQASAGKLAISAPKLTFYGERDGLEEGSLSAASGEVSNDYRKVSFRGDVVLKSSLGYTLQAQQLDYDHETQTATSEGEVLVSKNTMTLQGSGLTFKLKQQQLKLDSQVRAVFTEGLRK